MYIYGPIYGPTDRCKTSKILFVNSFVLRFVCNFSPNQAMLQNVHFLITLLTLLSLAPHPHPQNEI